MLDENKIEISNIIDELNAPSSFTNENQNQLIINKKIDRGIKKQFVNNLINQKY